MNLSDPSPSGQTRDSWSRSHPRRPSQTHQFPHGSRHHRSARAAEKITEPPSDGQAASKSPAAEANQKVSATQAWGWSCGFWCRGVGIWDCC